MRQIFLIVSSSVAVWASASLAQESEPTDREVLETVEPASWMVEQESPARELCFVVRIGRSVRRFVFDYSEYFVDLEVLAPLPQPDVWFYVHMPVGVFEETSDYSQMGSTRVLHLTTDDVNQFANSGTVHLFESDIRLGRLVTDTEDPAEVCEPGTAFQFTAADPTAPEPEPVRNPTTSVITAEDLEELGKVSVAEMVNLRPTEAGTEPSDDALGHLPSDEEAIER